MLKCGKHCSSLRDGLPWWLRGKESTCNAGDVGSIPGLGGYPGEGNGNSLKFLPVKSHGKRGLVGYIPWCDKRVGDLAT